MSVVCLVGREYPPFSGGGIGTYADAFARLVADRGVPVVVITAHNAERAEDEVATAGAPITVVRLPMAADDAWSGPHPSIASPLTERAWHRFEPHSVFALGVAKELPTLIDRFGITSIEGPDTGAPLAVALACREERAGGVSFVTHVHSPSAWIERINRSMDPRPEMHELQLLEAAQVKSSTAVITPSHGMAGHVRRLWQREATVLRYPIGRPAIAPSRGGAGVLFVGRLEYRKGIDTLLRAWPEVRTDQPLHVVGSEVIDHRVGLPIGSRLLRELPKHARRRVRMHGACPPAEVARLQAAAAVIAVPSPDDNFPYTCIEAMHAGRVVVAANAGGAAEMIEHGTSGLLFEPYDEAGLAAALSRALAMTSDVRALMGDAARSRIASLCGNERAIDARLAHLASLPEPSHAVSAATPEDALAAMIDDASARRRDPWSDPRPLTGSDALRTGAATRMVSGRMPAPRRALGKLLRWKSRG
ncbi:MAG: glycosyltransferase family 4 protein [Planctomycetota bacterium]